MFLRFVAAAVLTASISPAQTLLDEPVAGAAADRRTRTLVTWGASVRVWTLPEVKEQRVLRQGPFGEGGCLLDGRFVGAANGDLLAVHLRTGVAERLDTEIDMHDCIAATLSGRRGVLMIQRGMQIRFYERMARGKWRSRDIYSIYTPSYQGGLALADVNGDGRTDILCGNYWIEAPARFEESWRLFAIHTWFEEQNSATLRLSVRSAHELFAVQAHRSPARFARFTAPANPQQLWNQVPLWPELTLHHVHGLTLWRDRLVVGENNGDKSRILEERTVVDTGFPVLSLLPLDKQRLLAVGPSGVRIYRRK